MNRAKTVKNLLCLLFLLIPEFGYSLNIGFKEIDKSVKAKKTSVEIKLSQAVLYKKSRDFSRCHKKIKNINASDQITQFWILNLKRYCLLNDDSSSVTEIKSTIIAWQRAIPYPIDDVWQESAVESWFVLLERYKSKQKRLFWQGYEMVSKLIFNVEQRISLQKIALNYSLESNDLDHAKVFSNELNAVADFSSLNLLKKYNKEFPLYKIDLKYLSEQSEKEIITNKIKKKLLKYLKRKDYKAAFSITKDFSKYSREKQKNLYRIIRRHIYSKLTKNKSEKRQWFKRISYLSDKVQVKLVNYLFFKQMYETVYHLVNHLLTSSAKEPALHYKLSYRRAQAYLFLGDDHSAEKYFKNIAVQALVADSFVENSYIYLAMIYYRKKLFSKSIQLLERYVLLYKEPIKNMQALYLLWKSSVNDNQLVKAGLYKDKLIRLYPLTYYGLLAQLSNKKLIFEKKNDKEHKLVFLNNSTQHKRWKRFMLLTKVKYFKAARYEHSLIAWDEQAQSPLIKVKTFLLQENYYAAIKKYQEIIDQDASYLTYESLRLVFPKIFMKSIKARSSNYAFLSPEIVLSIIKQESAFREGAMSSAGARGLMQLMPRTAQELARRYRIKKFNYKTDLLRADTNIRLGSRYLNQMIKAFNGHKSFAFAAYNLGIGNVRKWLKNRDLSYLVDLKSDELHKTENELWFEELPWAETSFYVKAVSRNYILYRILNGHSLEDISKNPWH